MESHWESADRIEDGIDSHPPSKVWEVLVEMYTGTSRGHLGTNKTINKIQQRYYWLYLRGDVEMWRQQYDTCTAT